MTPQTPLVLVGRAFDRYRVEAYLGEGGTAVVYRVRHDRLGTRFALKVLRSPSPDTVSRLRVEGRAMGAVSHPNVLAVADVIDVDGNPALVVEYVDGPTLAELLAGGPIPLPAADRLARGLLAGLAGAHAAGLVHRDLKPGNVLLAPAGPDVFPKISDFGLARILDTDEATATRAGATLGTPAYMAPEQFGDAAVDARADVFAAGAVLYELVTGKVAFSGGRALLLLQRAARGEVRPMRDLVPEVPDRIVRAVEAALSPEPGDRPADGAELLQRWEDGTPPPPPDPGLVERVLALRPEIAGDPISELNSTVTDSVFELPPPEPPRRDRRFAAAVGAALLGVGILLPAALWWAWGREPEPEPTVSRLTADPELEVEPASSRDGSTLAWTDGTDVFVADARLQRPPRNLTSDLDGVASGPAISPDGQQIAFSLDGRLVIRPIGGGPAEVLTEPPAYQPTWSPDGRQLAIVTERPADPYDRTDFASRLAVVDRETGARRPILPDTDAIDPSWSPDGRWIAFSSGLTGIEVVSADGATRSGSLSWGLSPQWTDRDLVFLLRNPSGSTGIYALPRQADGMPGGPPRSVVPATLGDAQKLAVGADGWVVGVVERSANLVGFALDPDRLEVVGPPTDWTAGAHRLVGPTFSPDGRRLAFTSTSPYEELLVSDGLGPDLRWVAHSYHGHYTRGPRFAPDGRTIWFYGTRGSDGEGIYRQPLDPADAEPALASTGAPKRVWMAIPSPDGRRLATTDDQLHLYVVSVDAPWGPQLAAQADRAPVGLMPADWSPDGRTLLLIDGAGRVARLEVGSDRPEMLIDDPSAIYAAWARDGRVLTAGGSRISRWDPEHGLVQIGSIAPRTAPTAECLAVSPDDRQLVVVATATTGDLFGVDFVRRDAEDGWWSVSQPGGGAP